MTFHNFLGELVKISSMSSLHMANPPPCGSVTVPVSVGLGKGPVLCLSIGGDFSYFE